MRSQYSPVSRVRFVVNISHGRGDTHAKSFTRAHA